MRTRRHRLVGATSALTVTMFAGVLVSVAGSSPSWGTAPPPLAQPITTLAGTGVEGFGGDDGPAVNAQIAFPQAVASDGAGSVYIADTRNHRIRKVDPAGKMTTVAGTGPTGPGAGDFSGDGGPASQARLNTPRGITVDDDGNLYIADTWNQRIRKVDTSGVISTIAGTGVGTTPQTTFGVSPVGNDGVLGAYGGDGGPATLASFYSPTGLTVDDDGNLFVADTWNHRIRKVDRSGTITTVAGIGAAASLGGFSGDGGSATLAQLNAPSGVDVDEAGNLFVSDTLNRRIRKVDPSGTITTVAGGGSPGDGVGDGGPATAAALMFPQSLSVDRTVNLYVAYTENDRVRKISVAGTITTVAGGGEPASGVGDGGAATDGRLDTPVGVHVDPADNVTVVEREGARVRLLGAIAAAIADDSDPVLAGESLAYVLTASNYSSMPAEDVMINHGLPEGVTDISAMTSRGRCVAKKRRLRCSIGTLPPASVARVEVSVTAPSTPGNIMSSVQLSAVHPDRVLVDNGDAERTVVQPPSIKVTMADAPDPATEGDILTYTVSVTNNLGSTATDVVVEDLLPRRLSFHSASASQGTCSGSTGTPICSLGAMPVGATATVTLRAVALDGGLIANTVTARSSESPTGRAATTSTQVSAAECGSVIMQSTTLPDDIGPCVGPGVVIGADDITVDLGGHRVIGFATPGDGTVTGISLPWRTGVTLRNGTVSGFDAGVAIVGGGSNTLSRLTVKDNLGPYLNNSALYGDGIVVVNSPDNEIVANHLVHNGTYDGIGILGTKSNNNTVQANVVEETVGPDPATFGQGIAVLNYWDANDMGKTITGTRIVGNVVRRSTGAGISNISSSRGSIVGNVVEDNGSADGYEANGIGVQMGLQADQHAQMLVQSNEVHRNAWDGIQLGYNGADQSQILDNNAADNNTARVAAADLHDLSTVPCGTNIWLRNTWGTGGYSPPCTGTAGTGPLVGDLGAIDAKIFRLPPGLDPLQPLRGQSRLST